MSQKLSDLSIFQDLRPRVREMFFVGDESLLHHRPKIAIIGTRKPNLYAKNATENLAHGLTARGACVVSGGALGIDIIAQEAALARTIMVSPSGLSVIYPQTNRQIIEKIAKNGLILSEHEPKYRPERHSFVARNRIIVHLSDAIIIPQADMASGSMQSARLAYETRRPLFVLAHRAGESPGTNFLLETGRATGIFDVDFFLENFENLIKNYKNPARLGSGAAFYEHLPREKSVSIAKSFKKNFDDEILDFCANAPSFEEAYEKFGEKLLEYELFGKIRRENGAVKPT